MLCLPTSPLIGAFFCPMKIKILITTYNRPKMLVDLLKNLKQQTNEHELSLLIVNDCSTLNYKPVLKYLKTAWFNRYDYFITEKNYGKRDYWQLINFAYHQLQSEQFDFIVQLPDDVLVVDDFFDKAIHAFKIIPDANKSCLNILNDYSRNGKSFWTNSKVVHHNFNGIGILNTGWVDMCYISTKNYLELLNFKINPVNYKWSDNKKLSSGVGRQISMRLVSSGNSIYQVNKSLVIHDDHPSVMHPEHRTEVPLITNHNLDNVTATMATFPGREGALEEAVASIINQVDELHIYMNDIDTYPFFSGNPKIKLYFSKDHRGDLGDAGKFYNSHLIKGYHFTVDDDIIYPADYVSTLIAAIEKNQRRAIISCHGRMFDKLPVQSYYKGHSAAYSCMHSMNNDVFAHVIGTGVLAYHTDTIQVNLDIFEYTNMADIWFSKYCNENNIPRIILAHRAKWIRTSKKYNKNGSIYVHQSINDSIQTEVTNSVKWDACPFVL